MIIVKEDNVERLDPLISQVYGLSVIYVTQCDFFWNQRRFNIKNIATDKKFDGSLVIKGMIFEVNLQKPQKEYLLKINCNKVIAFYPEVFCFVEKLKKFCFKIKDYYFCISWDMIPKNNINFKSMMIYHHLEWCIQNEERIKDHRVCDLNNIMDSVNPLIYILDFKFKSTLHTFFSGTRLDFSLQNYDDTFCTIDSKNPNPNSKLILKWEKYIGYPFPKSKILTLRKLRGKIYNIDGEKVILNKTSRFIMSLIPNERSNSNLVKDSEQISKEWKKRGYELDNSFHYVGLATHFRNRKFMLLNHVNGKIFRVDTTNQTVDEISINLYVKKIVKKR